MILNKSRQVLVEDTLHIPGLILFGHNISSRAALPLETHVHEGCIEIVVIIKGNECYYVENKRFELSGGDVFVSFVSQPHKSGNAVQGVCEILWFQINPSVQKDFLGLSDSLANLLKDRLSSIDTHVMKTDKENISLLKKSFESFLKFKPENMLYGQSLFVTFLSTLLFVQEEFRRDDALIKNILQYIENNIFDIIKIEEICSLYNISPSGFKHKFKEYTGVTPRDYINNRKILKATELLKIGRSITETAMLLSFNTSDYFSVVFKKYMGCSPSDYRNSS